MCSWVRLHMVTEHLEAAGTCCAGHSSAPLSAGSGLGLFFFIVFSICFLSAGLKYYNPSNKKKIIKLNPPSANAFEGLEGCTREWQELYLNQVCFQTQIFPSLPFFKAIIWPSCLPRVFNHTHTQQGCCSGSCGKAWNWGALRAGCPAPRLGVGLHHWMEKEAGGCSWQGEVRMRSSRVGFRGFLNAVWETALCWQQGKAREGTK